MNHTAIDQYQKIRRHGSIQGASPHQLILILFDNALERVTMARGCMTRAEIAEKSHHIAVAASILDGLRAAANPAVGGDIADNLQALYGYCIRLLLRANLHNQPELLTEVLELVREIRTAWVEIPPEYHYHGSAQPAAAAVAR